MKEKKLKKWKAGKKERMNKFFVEELTERKIKLNKSINEKNE